MIIGLITERINRWGHNWYWKNHGQVIRTVKKIWLKEHKSDKFVLEA